jgi:hypothetical protein
MISKAFFGKPVKLPTDGVKLAAGRHDAAPHRERKRRQPARDQFMRVLAECDVLRYVAEQPRESTAHTRRLLERAIPFAIDQLRRIEPRALLRLERDIRPGLMRMALSGGSVP